MHVLIVRRSCDLYKDTTWQVSKLSSSGSNLDLNIDFLFWPVNSYYPWKKKFSHSKAFFWDPSGLKLNCPSNLAEEGLHPSLIAKFKLTFPALAIFVSDVSVLFI